ncbi:hypothetical protein ACHAXR_011897 [Thalassiosira sp. AJA248-18]
MRGLTRKIHAGIPTVAKSSCRGSNHHHQQQQTRTFLSHQSRNTAIQSLFQHLETNYGNLPSLIDTGPASETIVSTDGILHPHHLTRLFRHEATALHVPGFYLPESAKRLGEELILESKSNSNNWKVSTSRGLESSDVGTLGEHSPYNVAVARDYQRSSRDDEGGERSSSSSPIDEYFEGVQREFQFRRRRNKRHGNKDGDDDSDRYQLWPLDKLRLELEEAWPSGAGLAREMVSEQQQQQQQRGNDNQQLSYPRPFGGGLPRIMRGPTRWKRGFIHVDELGPLNTNRGLFSANIYLTMPDGSSGDMEEDNNITEDARAAGDNAKSDWRRDMGGLYVWPLGVRSRWDWYRNAMTLSSLSAQDPEMQLNLKHVLGKPNIIRPKPGDLVLLCAQRI